MSSKNRTNSIHRKEIVSEIEDFISSLQECGDSGSDPLLKMKIMRLEEEKRWIQNHRADQVSSAALS